MAAKTWKEWEKPLIELEAGLAKLKQQVEALAGPQRVALEEKIEDLERRRDNYINVMYSRLGPWEKVLVARAEKRPYTLDYINALFTDFVELEGDRRFGADKAIVGGPARFEGRPVMVLGHQKGRNIQERALRNFGMAKPEGYRKAIRLMDMADRFRMPVVTFVDTPAADPGVESESRGISEAIAASMLKMFELQTPVVSVVIGEGGSGGAIGIACANTVLMLEHSIYSVIPPEGCAAILWRDPEKAPQAAAALKLTADNALELGLVDKVLPEPRGGAHRDPAEAAQVVRGALSESLANLLPLAPEQLRAQRYEKFRAMGRTLGPNAVANV
ncbi:MAG: acetyl-CoA carboxylase carboxyltransferase subunit alpha [Fimbriimonadaceae bacterium]|nr:Acetyl-coenzyme A carboxylase carboxyl transferase subunit alpha [Fimbriimonadaceae bacterium]MCC6352053.1 acetyl-CoA carboxylase carboxyltransferase subunit alpha [Fimbriimonadaceae bacterium]MCL4285877.1 acetyl-CoA carboxylase carboxyltransferase subunit alpha [Fimbriimonadaceae bacterium]QOJ11802.1 MAG: acetyl-CoA carboxylase carboxyltransferase subunit alpha [Chthonomonadaceae bacterium]WKZ79879.1 MAG: acetyl-CoA carboxylase carboxyltransferase subunit alpha [Fimbriimonadaceae bacterium]